MSRNPNCLEISTFRAVEIIPDRPLDRSDRNIQSPFVFGDTSCLSGLNPFERVSSEFHPVQRKYTQILRGITALWKSMYTQNTLNFPQKFYFFIFITHLFSKWSIKHEGPTEINFPRLRGVL